MRCKIDPEYPAALAERASAYVQAGEQRLWDREDAAQFLQYAIDDYRAAIEQGDDSIYTLWNLGWAYFLLGDQPASLEYTDRALEKAPQQIGLYLNHALALRALGKVDDAFAAVQEAYQRAIEQPTSSSNFYFHAAIFDITQQLRAFPNEDLQKLLKDVKEKYVSLRYLKGQPVEPTGCAITAVAFFKGLNDNNELIDPAEEFPAQTEAVYLGFDYTDLPTDGEIEAVVYFFDKEDETLTVQEKLNLEAERHRLHPHHFALHQGGRPIVRLVPRGYSHQRRISGQRGIYGGVSEPPGGFAQASPGLVFSVRLEVFCNRLRGQVVAGLIPVRIGVVVQLAALDALFPEGGREVQELDAVALREVGQEFLLRVVIGVEGVVAQILRFPLKVAVIAFAQLHRHAALQNVVDIRRIPDARPVDVLFAGHVDQQETPALRLDLPLHVHQRLFDRGEFVRLGHRVVVGAHRQQVEILQHHLNQPGFGAGRHRIAIVRRRGSLCWGKPSSSQYCDQVRHDQLIATAWNG